MEKSVELFCKILKAKKPKEIKSLIKELRTSKVEDKYQQHKEYLKQIKLQ